jgi:adenylate cyclase
MADDTPAPPPDSRRLCAVLLADVTGFSRLMGESEPRALAALGRVRAGFEQTVPRHRGTLEVAVGDCFVALFDSAADAVAAAVEIQRGLAATHATVSDQGRIRIGIHLGDVVRRGTEIFGDSVNVAARLQTVAKPGGIAVSGDVYRASRGRVNAPFRDLGRKRLKNITEPVRIYELEPRDLLPTAEPAPATEPRSARAWLAVGGAAITLAAALAAVGLLFGTDRGALLAPGPPAPALRVAAATAPAEDAPSVERPRAVGVTGIAARGDVPEWMREVTRDGLNTVLSKVHVLRVFSREKIDFVRDRRGLKEIEVAEALGIEKMIAGTVELVGERLILEARVVDTATGVLEASERVEGGSDELIELQNRLAATLLDALKVVLAPDDRRQLFAKRTNDTLDGYKMLADTLGDVSPPAVDPAPAIPDTGDTSWWPPWTASAHAAEAVEDAPIRAVLEAYRTALEQKNLDALAGVHVELTEPQRAALGKYFESADALRVQLADVEVIREGNEALATFTRRDAFTDKRSGKPVELEVRLSSVVVQVQGAWKLRGVKRS